MLTVLTPATNFRLVSLDTVKGDLGFDDVDTARDARLGRYIDEASAAIATYCRRVWPVEEVRETIDPRCRAQRLLLERYPVIAISELTIAGDEVDPDDIEIDAAPGFVYRMDTAGDERIAWEGGRTIATYTAGFLLPDDERETGDTLTLDLPADVQRAAAMLSARIWHGAGRDASVRGLQYADGSRIDYGMQAGASSSGEMPTDVAALLAPWRAQVL